MQKIIILISFLFIYISSSATLVNFEDSLMQFEYGYFNAKSDSERVSKLIIKADILINNGIIGKELTYEYNRIQKLNYNPNNKKLIWNSIVSAYYQSDINEAQYQISMYKSIIQDTSTNFLYLDFLIKQEIPDYDYKAELGVLSSKDSLFSVFQDIDSIQHLNNKSKLRSQIASALLPGVGSMATGYVGRGFTSLLINSGAVVGLVALLKNKLYLNSIGYGLLFELKFYLGNIKLTGNLSEDKFNKEQNCLLKNKEAILNILNKKYPVKFYHLGDITPE